MAKADLTAARLREILDYCPSTGVFSWRVPSGRWGRIKAGSAAGSPNHYGHLRISINGTSYYAHRLAWLYVTGEWPVNDIDHINSNRADNKFVNLRDVAHRTNAENRSRAHRNKASGLPLGVSLDRRDGAFRADITVDGKAISLGRFCDPVEAHNAYLDAKRRLHVGCVI